MYRVAVVEDEPANARLLQEYLARYGAEQGLALQISRFADGQAFCDAYRANFDLIFLDVRMPRLDGFAAARRIRQVDPSVVLVFLTNMAQYAIRGYEVDALDYLVKPLTYEALCFKFGKIRRALRARQTKSLLVTTRDRVQRIGASQILYIEIFNHSLCYHTLNGDYTQTGSTSLSDLEKELAGDFFARCHNCYLVNLRMVDTVEENTVWVHDVPLRMSRGRKKAFLAALAASYLEGAGT